IMEPGQYRQRGVRQIFLWASPGYQTGGGHLLTGRRTVVGLGMAHSSVEKAGLIALVKMKFLPVALEEDRNQGLVPVFVCAKLGTTGVCAFDSLSELGPICAAEGLWLHIDAAYAGTAFLCPEFRLFLNGIEYADSFTFNPSKWMMVHFDCTAFWVKDKYKLQQTFRVNPVYLRHADSGDAIDFMHWQIPLSRRFRSLKLWFVIRSFGSNTSRRTTVTKVSNRLFLLIFLKQGPNWLTEKVLKELSKSGSLFLIPATIRDKFIICFTVTSQFTTREDILQDWHIIQQTAAQIITQHYILNPSNSADGAKIRNIISNPSPIADHGTSPSHTEVEERKAPFRKIIVQPKKVAVSPTTCVVSQHLEAQVDPLDDCFPEDVPDVTKHKLSSFLFSYLSVQDKKKTACSLSCNSVNSIERPPPSKASEKNGSHPSDKILSKLPEEVMMLKKVPSENSKFYSVPSFPECSIQRGIQLPCCPLQAIV
uniref:Histidine decarboxylase n=1 Tax=Chelydra serpentina TaxID=8475 RepID=A0A8C3S4Z2_CHESE